MKNTTITLAAAAVAGLLTVTAAPALAGGHGNKPAKVELCHKPGTPAEKTLKVPSSAVPGHLGHGDYLGACEPAVEPTPGPEPEPTPDPEPTEEPTTVPTEDPTPEPTPEPTEDPTTEPDPDPEPTPEPEPTVEPDPEPTTEPTEEPEQPEPTTVPEPTTEPTSEPATEPEPVAVVALPKLPTGSIWHDCEIGWTYDLDAAWDAEFTHIWIVDPNGRNLGEGDDGTRVSGAHEIHVGVAPGKTYRGIPVVGLDMTPDWTPVESENGYVTHAYRTFTVALPDPRDCGTQIGTPRAAADTPDDDAADTTATSDAANTTAPTSKHLADTGGRHAGWSAAGVLAIAAGLILIARGRWAK